MARAIQNEKGEWISEPVSWRLDDIKEARKLLKLRFDDATFSLETVQEMMTALKSDFGDDPEQIERAIMQFFKKKK